MMKRFLAFLPLTVIVAACSSGGVSTGGVVDTWDPEAEVKRAEAERKSAQEDKAYCEDLLDKPTHVYDVWRGYLEGNRFYTTAKFCPSFYEIGKTYTSEDGNQTKVIKEGDDVIIYQKTVFGTSKRKYKFIQ